MQKTFGWRLRKGRRNRRAGFRDRKRTSRRRSRSVSFNLAPFRLPFELREDAPGTPWSQVLPGSRWSMDAELEHILEMAEIPRSGDTCIQANEIGPLVE